MPTEEERRATLRSLPRRFALEGDVTDAPRRRPRRPTSPPAPVAPPVETPAPEPVGPVGEALTWEQVGELADEVNGADGPDTVVMATVTLLDGTTVTLPCRDLTVGVAALPAINEDDSKQTTITVHDAPETTEDAVQRGLRDMMERRQHVGPKRPGPTRW